jgi:iron(III) transport system substrate-binding protein
LKSISNFSRVVSMFRAFVAVCVLLATPLFVAGCSRDGDALVLYSGRSKALVQPLVDRFQEETGIRVRVRYGGTAQLAIALMEEGADSPADLFWAQDAGALGALSQADLLSPLGELATDNLAAFRGERGAWVATSGRARVLAYSPTRVEERELPSSIFDLTDERWRGRVGWAPANGSFQSFVTAMHAATGEEATRAWLAAMRDNGAVSFPNNSSLLQAIAAGTIDAAITNHYYLLRLVADDPRFPAAQTAFEAGDIGNLVNVAGLGILASSSRREQAEAFARAMLSPEAQRFFAQQTYEYPVIELDLAERPGDLMSLAELERTAPRIALDALADLETSLSLLREVELL